MLLRKRLYLAQILLFSFSFLRINVICLFVDKFYKKHIYFLANDLEVENYYCCISFFARKVYLVAQVIFYEQHLNLHVNGVNNRRRKPRPLLEI